MVFQNLHRFSFQDLDDIILGAHFFSCGGGGALENGRQLIEEAKRALNKRGVDYIGYLDPTDVPDDAWLPMLGAIGAPQKFLEYGYGKSPVTAFLAHERLIQNRLGNPAFSFYSAVAAESGAIAHGMALLVAATLGLPIVDGDGAGRAVPSLPMVTFANPLTEANIQLSPCVLTSETPVKDGGVSMSLDCNDPATLDALARGIISAGAGFEQRSSLSCFAMTGGQLKQPNAVVPNTLTKSRDLGRSIRTSRNPLEAVRSLPTAQRVCAGVITRVDSSTRVGFDWLDIHIVDREQGEFVVLAKNENMLVWSRRKDAPVVLSPDLICYIQPDGTVLSNTEIEARFRRGEAKIPVVLFALRSPKALDNIWSHKQFSEVFEAYGYYGSYHTPRITTISESYHIGREAVEI